MLYLVGIGLSDEKDITVRGLEAVKKCDFVYLESYTSKLQCSLDDLEKLYNKKIILADRELVEKKADEILDKAKTNNVAFLVIGDVFGATTHTDLKLRALEKGVKVKVIHNASILNALGAVGLELYKYGKVTSIPFENENVTAPYDVLEMNQKMGLHTLFLLDLRPSEDRFMDAVEGIDFLKKIEKKKEKKIVTDDTLGIICAAVGSDNEEIKVGKLKEIKQIKLKKYPQCLIIPGKLHFMEEEALKIYLK